MKLPDNLSSTLVASMGDIVKVRILSAFAEMLETHSYDGISVKALCERASVSRPTFYHHFEGKYEIAQWYWAVGASRHLLRVGDDLTWSESLRLCYNEAFENMDFFSKVNAGNEAMYESCLSFAVRLRASALQERLKSRLGERESGDLCFQAECFAEGEGAMVLRWMTSAQPLDPNVFADMMTRCVPDELRRLMDGWAKVRG